MRAPGRLRRSTALLMIILVGSAVLLSVELSLFRTGLLGVSLSGPQPGSPPSSPPSPRASSQLGAVLVVANLIVSSTGTVTNGSARTLNETTPIPRLPMYIYKEGQDIVRPVLLYTNASGELFEHLIPGNYSISTNDASFQLNSTFVCIGGLTTKLAISVVNAYHRASFFEVYDADGFGIVEPWDKVSVTVPLGTSYAYNESLHVQFAGGPVASAIQSLVVSSYQGRNGIWLVLKPTTAFEILGSNVCYVITDEPKVVVSYLGG